MSQITRHMLLAALLFGACVPKAANQSQPKTTEVPHTTIKKQTVGNCWLYAVVGWAESLNKMATKQNLNISESHLSYWSFFHELVEEPALEKLAVGGSWERASALFLKYGWMLEHEFAPEESLKAASDRQEHAEEYINEQLKVGGTLHGEASRTTENVMAELDKAFKVKMEFLQKRARSASDLIVADTRGKTTTLDKLLKSPLEKWQTLLVPQEEGAQVVSEQTQAQRMQMIRRMQRALNDHMPVVISFMVGFDALDEKDGMFKIEKYRERGGLGDQGGHMVVVTDYVVDDVPGVGTIGEGDVSDDLKAKALTGKIRYLKVKNSWGVDRPERGLTDGFSRLQMDYLLTNLPWSDGEKALTTTLYSSLMEIFLPPGY